MAEVVAAPWTAQEISTDKVTKKQIVEFLQAHGNSEFLTRHSLKGSVANVTKKAKKDDLSTAYSDLFASKAFRSDSDDQQNVQLRAELATTKAENAASHAADHKDEEKKVKVEIVYFVKTTTKPGDMSTFPRKGDTVEIFYTGKLDDGTTFDTNAPSAAAKAPKAGGAATPAAGVKAKVAEPLKVQVGKGKLVRGFDEGLMQVSKGEKAKLVIPSEYGYGKKGKPESKIPPNATLTFDVEVVNIY